MKEIKLYKSPIKSLRLLFLSSLFFIPSLYFILIEKSPNSAFFSALGFFGIGFSLSLFNILDRRVQIIINEIGIWDRSLNEEIIKWEFIEKAYAIEIHKQIFVPLKTNKNFKPRKKLYKWASFLNKISGGQKVNLNFSYIKIDIHKVVDFINIMKSENITERKKLIKSYLLSFKS